ncbi:hypothetical protein FE257_010084 [Aspergillus nanangensis]|uniref:Uncharacterized protein n=1 Tax=Aspergillus nanangensis TaxID=2582783 RepID=A0AAD4CJD2_ASPNN|nr:hypothetical protein FE257_010084 [Aspergillus nanangensis]
MKTSVIAATLTTLAGLVSATPVDKRSAVATIRFEGAADAGFTQGFLVDDQIYGIFDKLSISHIKGAEGAVCTFHGVDGSTTVVSGSQTVDVGPPQTQIWGTCKSL